jgi:hypothetical protein
MPLGNPQGGAGYAAEFQSSALPWMTSSIAPTAPNPMKINFGMVTRFVALTNLSTGSIANGPNLQCAVTYYGAARATNFVTILPGQTLYLEWRITQVFLQSSAGSCSFSLAAGLTTIPLQNYYNLTGSAADGTAWPGIG